ncbi:putative oxidoreductase [Austwickia sp. TVS 96-490-7B]|uniref:aldo/keto reductase n=1 Tax=Austwickia sp. TVS 96-490-7B TaxID=2830843 RepID=UPI001C572525|nr:aldo/keto reductase [Austwickia sp. TVS 96-490-7B]MBW3084656.1 putative oxidoreductase [Austwickia sp. TVS 96-490-7B]
MTQTPMIPLTSASSASHIPQLGYGVYKLTPDQAVECVGEALRVGYRSIDTASFYGNEDGVGRAVRDSDIPREEIFVTTKLWNDAHGYEQTLRAFEESRNRLGLDYVDLYLIHWPCPGQDQYVDTWKALLHLRDEGVIRAAGVSNFEPEHLDRLVEETGMAPAVNQVELHPYLAQMPLRAAAERHGVVVEAWSPLARGGALFADPVVVQIAQEVGATPAQVVLAWHLAHGTVVIPKSATLSRIAENFAAIDVTLDDRQLALLDGLDRDGRTGPDPRVFGA